MDSYGSLVDGFFWVFVFLIDSMQILSAVLDRSVSPDVLNRYKQVAIFDFLYVQV